MSIDEKIIAELVDFIEEGRFIWALDGDKN
jgi:hypothetical protein